MISHTFLNILFTVHLMYVPISKCKKILKKINKHSLWNLKAESWLLLIKTFDYIFKIKVCKSFVRTYYKPSESVHNTPFVVIVLHPFHTYNLLNKSLIFTLRKTLRNSSEFFFSPSYISHKKNICWRFSVLIHSQRSAEIWGLLRTKYCKKNKVSWTYSS